MKKVNEMNEYNELISQLETLEKPNLEIDRKIADLFDPNVDIFGIKLNRHKMKEDGSFTFVGVGRDLTPNITRNLDEALKLISKDWTWTIWTVAPTNSNKKTEYGCELYHPEYGVVRSEKITSQNDYDSYNTCIEPAINSAIAVCLAAVKMKVLMSEINHE